MLSGDVLVSSVLGVAAIVSALLISRWYYTKSRMDLEKVRSDLESQNVSIFRITNAQNSNEQDEPFKGSDGKWNVKWARTVNEPTVVFSDKIEAKIIRKAEDSK